jgi:membrane protease YdiL (CAAX protease family)
MLVILALAAFSAAFVLLDQAFNHFVTSRFPPIGASVWLATAYGLASRLHLIVPLAVASVWRPRMLGLRQGETRRHWRRLLLTLLANCGIVGGYLLLTRGTTPYSGHEWLITEVVTVPLVEETMWRGAVFAMLCAAFARIYPDHMGTTLAVWAGGIAFGLLHAANALVGVPIGFVAVQVLNAAVWGVVYGYARAVTGSLYPPLILHAAMNLIVVLH